MASNRIKRSSLRPILALLTSLAIMIIIVVVTVKSISLTNTGTYSGWQRAVYATVSTILASILTTFVTSEIRMLWVLLVDQGLYEPQSTERLLKLSSKWRAVLSVGSISEMLDNWHIELSYIATGLITTAIVASFTPTQAVRQVGQYNVETSTGQLYIGSNCAISLPTTPDMSGYYWNRNDGTSVTVNAAGGGCPPRQAITLMGTINLQDPSAYAYADQGVAVHSSGIGAPVAVYGSAAYMPQNFAQLEATYGSNLINTTQCVPVMIKNPVSCRIGGQVNIQSHLVSATSDDGLCTIAQEMPFFDPYYNATMSKGICTYGQVGQAKIVLGATRGYTTWLAISIGDAGFNPDTNVNPPPGTTYAVTCDVDTRDAFDFRTIALSLHNTGVSSDSSSKSRFGRVLSALPDNNGCSPPLDYGDNTGILAIAATANWQPLLEYTGLDGYFDSIGQFAIGATSTTPRQAPWAFSNSRNALEDVFGLTAALVASRINSTSMVLPAQATIFYTRIGSGSIFSLLYTLPPLFATLTLLTQIIMSRGSRVHEWSTIQLENMMGSNQNAAVERTTITSLY